MVIPSGILFFLISTILTVGSAIIIFRKFIKDKAGASGVLKALAVVLALVGPVGSIVVLINYTSTVTEITTGGHKTFNTLGSFAYEAPDGQVVDIDLSNEYDGYIVNLTDSVMIKDLLMYGMGISFDNGAVIPPHSSINTYGVPDYYPWQMPPSEISVNNNLPMGTKTWIHYESVSMRDIGAQ